MVFMYLHVCHTIEIIIVEKTQLSQTHAETSFMWGCLRSFHHFSGEFVG